MTDHMNAPNSTENHNVEEKSTNLLGLAGK